MTEPDALERTRRAMAALDLIERARRQRLRYQQAAMKETERQRKLDEIDAMIADLGDMTG
jgi:hypothetical protein